MEWYGWLFLILTIVAVVSLIVVLVFKSRPIICGLTEDERKALGDVEKKRIEKELEVERDRQKQLTVIAMTLKAKIDELENMFNEDNLKVETIRASEFENLLSDTNAAGRELDKLLGIGQPDDED